MASLLLMLVLVMVAVLVLLVMVVVQVVPATSYHLGNTAWRSCCWSCRSCWSCSSCCCRQGSIMVLLGVSKSALSTEVGYDVDFRFCTLVVGSNIRHRPLPLKKLKINMDIFKLVKIISNLNMSKLVSMLRKYT